MTKSQRNNKVFNFRWYKVKNYSGLTPDALKQIKNLAVLSERNPIKQEYVAAEMTALLVSLQLLAPIT